jgi:hypothetical protein
MWCCSLTDGNSWFGDTYFDTNKWIRGLSYMASHVSHLNIYFQAANVVPGQGDLAHVRQRRPA